MQPNQVADVAPVVQSWTIMSVQLSDGRKMVCVRVNSATGAAVHFETPARAKAIAEQLIEAARIAESGLIVPGHNGQGPGG